MIEAYVATMLGVALAQSAPGPNFLAVVSAALGQGRRSALCTVLGVSLGMMVWAVAIAGGLAAVLALHPGFLVVMKVLGGGYLIYLGLRALMAARHGSGVTLNASNTQRSDVAAFRRGLLVVISNPKAALMWSAVGAHLFGSGLTGWQVVAFGPMATLSSLVIYGSYAFLFSGGFAARTYAKFSRWIEAALGAVFGSLGCALLISGMRDAGARG